MIEAKYTKKDTFGGNPMTKKCGNLFVFVIITAAFISGGHACKKQVAETDESWEMDSRSYQLGVIAAFSEVVAIGVKKLALSAPLPPEEMDRLLPDAERIAKENGASIYLEKDFLVTDLFPENITEGKYVLLIYLNPVKDEYFALKSQKEDLIATGQYQGEARTSIARQMGRLLSYPETQIEKMLTKD